MTDDEFLDLLDRRGADLSLWPPLEQAAAVAVLKRSDAARRQLRLAERAAALIASPPPATRELAAEILAALPPAQAVRAPVPRSLVASAGATLMASLVAGLMLGWLGLVADPLGSEPDDLEQNIAIAFSMDDNYGS